jgi:hypothetical protein
MSEGSVASIALFLASVTPFSLTFLAFVIGLNKKKRLGYRGCFVDCFYFACRLESCLRCADICEAMHMASFDLR